MARQWVTDELWGEIEALLPPEPPKPKGGRPRVPDRQCLVGIVFVLRTGCAWNDLPAELDCGHGSTCWRRFQSWSEAGVWEGLWHRILDHLGRQKRIDWSRAVADSASVRAGFGGRIPGRIPRIGRKAAANAIC